MAKYRFHVLAVPHTVTDHTYSACAFTQKVLKFCTMMSDRGHTVYHYGHERSKVACTEHITVMTDDVLTKTYGAYDWHTKAFKHSTDDAVHGVFNMRAAEEVARRKAPGDFLLMFWGIGHAHVAKVHANDMYIVEPGIGSYNDLVAPFAVFESYAVMHHIYGKYNKLPRFFDAVVPNYFDVRDFIDASHPDVDVIQQNIETYALSRPGPSSDGCITLSAAMGLPMRSFVLMIARVIPTKGIQLALEACKCAGKVLVLLGQGSIKNAVSKDLKYTEIAADQIGTEATTALASQTCVVCHMGYAEPRERAVLLARAESVLLPSLYAEPFGGVNVEAQISGVPVVTTDWGAFPETVVHGVSGYRCRTLEQFTWALKNVGALDRRPIRQRAIANYSLDKVAQMYEEYFSMLKTVRGGKGFYQENEARTQLSWLQKE